MRGNPTPWYFLIRRKSRQGAAEPQLRIALKNSHRQLRRSYRARSVRIPQVGSATLYRGR